MQPEATFTTQSLGRASTCSVDQSVISLEFPKKINMVLLLFWVFFLRLSHMSNEFTAIQTFLLSSAIPLVSITPLIHDLFF